VSARHSSQPSFATIGDNTIDEYVTSDGLRRYVGGNALNVAVNLSRLGRTCRYAGAVGQDAAGQAVRRACETHGLDTELLRTLLGHTSVSRVVIGDGGDRRFAAEDFAVCADYRPSEDDLDVLQRCAVVHIGRLEGADIVRAALARHGVLVSQDCAVADGFDNLAVAFCSAGDDLEHGRAEVANAHEAGARLAVATCGAAGSVAFDGTTWWTRPAQPITPVDTTGAGDSYIAGFLASFALSGDVEAAMAAGTSAAAQTCRHLGSWPQQPLDTR
jgi:fructoselysine 6-kinase